MWGAVALFSFVRSFVCFFDTFHIDIDYELCLFIWYQFVELWGDMVLFFGDRNHRSVGTWKSWRARLKIKLKTFGCSWILRYANRQRYFYFFSLSLSPSPSLPPSPSLSLFCFVCVGRLLSPCADNTRDKVGGAWSMKITICNNDFGWLWSNWLFVIDWFYFCRVLFITRFAWNVRALSLIDWNPQNK